MFAHPPREKEWVSWLAVALWSLIIFFAIPFARSIQAFASEHFGRQFFTAVVLAAVAAAAIGALVYLRRLHPGRLAPRLAWLAGVLFLYLYFTFQLRRNPEESLHFIEYGALGFLAFRAWTHRMRDPAVYFAAALVASLAGTLDEIIQWLIPGRFFDFRDVRLNLLAGALVLIGIAQGIRPPLIKRPARARSVRIVCWLAGGQLLLLGLCFANTPRLVNAYTQRFPRLAWLRHEENMAREPGYRHRDPEIGAFFSRFTPAGLRNQEATRAEEAARILDAYRAPSQYAPCLRIYSPLVDPFVHELRVRLFRRDRHLAQALESRGQDAAYRENCTVAFRENQIAEKYFGKTLRASRYVLAPDLKAELEQNADRNTPYTSPVGADLAAGQRRGWQWAALAAIMLAFLAAARYYRVREQQKEATRDQP